MVVRYGVNSRVNICASDDGIFVPRNDEINSVSRPMGGSNDVLFKIKTLKNIFKINGIRTIHFIVVNVEIPSNNMGPENVVASASKLSNCSRKSL